MVAGRQRGARHQRPPGRTDLAAFDKRCAACKCGGFTNPKGGCTEIPRPPQSRPRIMFSPHRSECAVKLSNIADNMFQLRPRPDACKPAHAHACRADHPTTKETYDLRHLFQPPPSFPPPQLVEKIKRLLAAARARREAAVARVRAQREQAKMDSKTESLEQTTAANTSTSPASGEASRSILPKVDSDPPPLGAAARRAGPTVDRKETAILLPGVEGAAVAGEGADAGRGRSGRTKGDAPPWKGFTLSDGMWRTLLLILAALLLFRRSARDTPRESVSTKWRQGRPSEGSQLL